MATGAASIVECEVRLAQMGGQGRAMASIATAGGSIPRLTGTEICCCALTRGFSWSAGPGWEKPRRVGGDSDRKGAVRPSRAETWSRWEPASAKAGRTY